MACVTVSGGNTSITSLLVVDWILNRLILTFFEIAAGNKRFVEQCLHPLPLASVLVLPFRPLKIIIVSNSKLFNRTFKNWLFVLLLGDPCKVISLL